MPDFISDFAHGSPLPASTQDAVRDEAPWMNVLTDQERADMVGFGCVIWPDRPITRRLTRHVVCTPSGHKFGAFKTLTECWLYAEALEVTPVGLGCAGRVLSVNPPRLPRPLSTVSQSMLVDETYGPVQGPDRAEPVPTSE